MNRVLLAFIGILLALPATANHPVDPSLGQNLLPNEQRWGLQERLQAGTKSYQLPEQLPDISRLPPARQHRLRELIRQHDLSLRFVKKAIKATRGAVRGGRMHSKPEYLSSLSEIVIGVDRGSFAGGTPLHAHEPILNALPAYTRVDILTPERFVPEVRKAIRRLGLESRSRVIANPKPPEDRGTTRWVRDTFLLADDGKRQTVFHSLGYQPRRDVFADDLRYLEFMRTSRRQVVTAPLFYRAGNFLLGVQGKRTLFVGADELIGNKEVYQHTVSHVPPVDAVLDVFAALTGADEVAVLPNTRRLFHVDMYLSFIDDGVVALLDPLDPEALPFEDLSVLHRARQMLTERGFRVVPVPTVAARISQFQSSTNMVPFRHRETGQRMALVPDFPDRLVRRHGREASLNALVEKSLRDAGITPIFVEDRFYPNQGNTHCAVVSLR